MVGAAVKNLISIGYVFTLFFFSYFHMFPVGQTKLACPPLLEQLLIILEY